jgi:hypothetical protein
MHAGVAIALALVCSLFASCSECSSIADCDVGDVCGQGACVAPLTVLSSTTVDDDFAVELEARFIVGTTTVRVERSSEQPGEPCVPFVPQEIVVENTTEDFAPVAVRFDGLSALGPAFDLVFRINSTDLAATFSGPALAPGVGGLDVTVDGDTSTPVDVGRTPTTVVSLAGDVDDATVTVVPIEGLPLPVQAMQFDETETRSVADVLLVYGLQTIDVRGTVNGTPRRCALLVEGDRGRRSDEARDVLEFLLVADTADGSVGAARLSTRRLTNTSHQIVDGDVSGELVSRSIDVVELVADSGVVEVAVVPVVASTPLHAIVRASRRGQHVGSFGPITLQPAAGETWVAGTVIISDDGDTTVVPSSSAPQVGTPW